MLDRCADGHGIGARHVNDVMLDYAENMIDDFFYEAERDLEDERVDEIEREGNPYRLRGWRRN